MQITVENSDYAVEYTAVNMDVAVSPQAEINVAVGDAARIDVGEALNYIKSGEKEIEQAVATGTAAFNLNAEQKTDAFNDNAADKTSEYNLNAAEKLSAFNENASDKTDAFNLNASNKTTDFNNNYTAKKALIDAEVATASGYAADAKQWAIGDPTEPTGNSAKYWADEAAATLANKQDTLVSGTNIKTINNQSLLGSGDITIGGAVDSVNGYTGVVVLTASDVGITEYTANEVETLWESL